MPELKIENVNDNILLHRKEVRYRLVFKDEPTPSRDKIREIIAKNTGSPKDLVIVENILLALEIIKGLLGALSQFHPIS